MSYWRTDVVWLSARVYSSLANCDDVDTVYISSEYTTETRT